jgi:NIPSNAP
LWIYQYFPNISRMTQNCCSVIELRQYTLHPGMRDVLIDLFDNEFVESQEAVGIQVIGQFRDLDRPDRFVWLRGFPDMPSRAQALGAFYGGPVWKKYRDAANATMVDSDDVRLLRPAHPESGFSLENTVRPSPDMRESRRECMAATIYSLDERAGTDFVDFFDSVVQRVLMDAGLSVLACLITESSPNNFPTLPVREGEKVFVWFSLFQDQTEFEYFYGAFERSRRWRSEISHELLHRLNGSPQVLKLSPTARSLIHSCSTNRIVTRSSRARY